MDRRIFPTTRPYGAARGATADAVPGRRASLTEPLTAAAAGDCLPSWRFAERSDEPLLAVADLLCRGDPTWGHRSHRETVSGVALASRGVRCGRRIERRRP